jgi:hypothetical protein
VARKNKKQQKMKLQLIHRSDYIFALNKAEDKLVLHAIVSENLEVISTKMAKCPLITHHLPLNNAPVLEGVELLPPLEDNELWITELTSSLKDEHTIKTAKTCLKSGYNKAKQKYKYTEEDVKTIMYWTANMTKGKLDSGLKECDIVDSIEVKLESLSKQKLPTAFDTETKEYIY